MIGFIIWCLVGCMWLGIGIACFFSKSTVGFWANVKVPEVTDRKAYNRAVGKLWIVFGIIFVFIGLPLLAGQNSPLIVLTLFGILIWAIVMMAIYELGIMRKYSRRQK